MNWLLPEYIADALPNEAAQIERLRRAMLDLFRVHGYELVMPPMLQNLDSLLTGSGSDLTLRTFKLVDQLSGRTLGLRADMTPQVARIDAHLLNRQGVTRHARPRPAPSRAARAARAAVGAVVLLVAATGGALAPGTMWKMNGFRRT